MSKQENLPSSVLSFIHNNQKVETIQMFNSTQLDEPILLHPYHGKLLSNVKDETIVTQNNLDVSPDTYAE